MKIGRRLLTDLTQFDLFAGKPAVATGNPTVTGEALMVRVDLIDEDPGNPRTEFPEADIHELAEDIRQQGLLQLIVVQPANAAGRYKIRFGALRLRAAVMAGLTEVPVTVCNRELDAYAQVAENQKRRGLSALDLARFIRSRVTMGESNAQISRRLGLDQTTIAHHLALLDLPPVLEAALLSGRRVHRHLGAALGAHRAVGGCPAVTPVGVRRRTVMGTPVHVSRLCRWLEGAFSSKVACSTRG